MTLKDLEPRRVWMEFDAITRVPRPSKREGLIIEYLIDFARRHALEWERDDAGNVVMRIPATAGCEAVPTVTLQSHMDMVCEKRGDVEFDFDRDPIRTRVGDGWVRAEGYDAGRRLRHRHGRGAGVAARPADGARASRGVVHRRRGDGASRVPSTSARV